METLIALFRGVNVGGRAKVPMVGLRELLASLGLEDVVTYIQSGNAVFQCPPGAEAGLAARIEQEVEARFGLDVAVLLRTPAQLVRISRGNPFLREAGELSKLHVVFMDTASKRAAVEGLDPDRSPPDRFRVDGREIYLLLPNGAGRSKLTIEYFERRLGVRATARNWNTLGKLVELSRGR